MNVLVAPASGGYFPNQLAAVTLYCDINCKPDVFMGCSGGALTGCLAQGCDWKTSDIYQISSLLNKDLFIKEWVWPLPSWSASFNRGSVFNSNAKADNFFASHVSDSIMVDTEMWIGAFNNDKSMAQLFVNKDQFNLNIGNVNFPSMSCLDPIVITHKATMSKVFRASLSIPAVVPPVSIMNENYSDGGQRFASPLTVLHKSLPENCHLTYINGFDINSRVPLPKNPTIVQNTLSAFAELTKGLTLADMEFARLAISKYGSCKPLHKEILSNITTDTLIDIEHMRKKYTRSILFIYPAYDSYIDITCFTGLDVVNSINKARDNMIAELVCY